MLGSDDVAGSEDGGPHERVLEFAHVPGPVVRHQGLGGFRVQVKRPAASGRRGLPQQVFRQKRHVAHAIAERRNLDFHDPKPVVQIFPELTDRHELLEVTVCGGDHPGFRTLRPLGPYRVVFVLLEHPEQLGLELGRRVSDLVQKNRPVAGDRKASLPI